MQFVDAAHQTSASSTPLSGLVPVSCMQCNRELMVWGDHLFALSDPALSTGTGRLGERAF